jgi:clan AA aspartic protease (TIGR02281 family)
MRAVLLLMWCCVCLSAQAQSQPQWLELGGDSVFRWFVDPDSVRGDRLQRSAVALFNAVSPDQQRVQSQRVQLEVDCVDPRARVVSRASFGQPMGAGAELSLPLARSSGWDVVRPGSANDAVRRHLCALGDADLARAARPASSPTAAPAPRPAAAATAGPLRVPLQRAGGTFGVEVTVNEAVKFVFILDSGASDIKIPADVFRRMLAAGVVNAGDFLGRRTYTIANGARIEADLYRLRSVRVGDRVIEDVTAGVGPQGSPFLLGQSFLRRFRGWSIDNANDQLVLE